MFPVFYPVQVMVPVPVYHGYAIPYPMWYPYPAEQQDSEPQPKRMRNKKWNPKSDPIHRVPEKEWVIHEEVQFQPEQWMVDFKEPEMSAFM